MSSILILISNDFQKIRPHCVSVRTQTLQMVLSAVSVTTELELVFSFRKSHSKR